MSDLDWTSPILEKITINRFARYLLKFGWLEEKCRNDSLTMFKGHVDDNNKQLVIILPRQESFVDWNKRLAESINLIAAIRNQSALSIAEEIILQQLDVLRIKLEQKIDTLPMEVAANIVSQLNQFLSYAAGAEENRKPYIERRSDSSKNYGYKCRFGQTFSGSFGFTIESPLNLEVLQLNLLRDFYNPPFSRRVIQRIVRGLELSKTCRERQDPDLLIANYETGFNGNMCEILAELLLSWETRYYEFETSWASDLPPPKEFSSVGQLRIEQSTAQYLRLAARALKKEDEPEDVTIVGQAVGLRMRETEPESEEEIGQERIVTIYGVSNKNERMSVRVFLQPDEYKLACDAHRDNRQVQVSGTLEKKGTIRYLLIPYGFKILDYR